VVVADARPAQRRVAWILADGALARQCHQALEQRGDLGPGDAEVAVTALGDEGDQLCALELLEVAARGRRLHV
jgi:hypothetical protein